MSLVPTLCSHAHISARHSPASHQDGSSETPQLHMPVRVFAAYETIVSEYIYNLYLLLVVVVVVLIIVYLLFRSNILIIMYLLLLCFNNSASCQPSSILM